jgi:hypothetical protein
LNSRFRLTAKAAPFALAVMCVLALSSCGNSSSSSTATTPTPAANNSVAVTANFGPTGEAGGFVNTIFTTITVCQHGTQTCTTIPNVEIDTGSIGLRILSSALGSVALTPITSGANTLEECTQFGDTSYTWGPMEFADVEIAGEKASDIAVQLLGAPPATVPADCLANPVNPNLPNGGDVDTLQTVGANGILGIGDGSVDCGSACTSVEFTTGYPYYLCPGGICSPVGVATGDQAANPVAAFTSTDRNGVMITLAAVGPTGGTSVTGTMTFGIATQADNALGSATLYAMDPCGDFPLVTYDGISYADTFCNTDTGSAFGGFLDTGSTGLYVSDAATLSFLGISDCGLSTAGAGFYCVSPGTTATLSNVGLFGNGGVGSGTLTSLNIFDATTLLKTDNAVFNDLGSDSGTSPSTDFFDLGAPFFIGRTVFIGIAGEAVPGGVSAPNGFVAF